MSTDVAQSHSGSPPPDSDGAGSLEGIRRRFLQFLSRYGTLAGLLIMILVFSLAAPEAFPTTSNIINVVNQSALTAIIASGLTMALVVGEFDLSIGYVASLAGVLVTGLIVRQGQPMWLAILSVLALGAAIGAVNGILVAKARVNAVIATLGVGTILIGVSFGYTAGAPISAGVPDAFLNLALGKVLGLPNPIWIMTVVLALLWVVLNRTDLGQRIQAVGGNIEAARLCGIPVDRVKIVAFVLTGVCAALTGILLASLLGSGTASAADSYLLDAFAAVFLGSATLRDGEFHIVGTLIGVIVINTGFNGLSIFGADTFYQYVFKGGILVLAVALSTVARRYARA